MRNAMTTRAPCSAKNTAGKSARTPRWWWGGGLEESLLWHPPREARILPGHICKRAAYSETEKRFHVNFSFEEEHM